MTQQERLRPAPVDADPKDSEATSTATNQSEGARPADPRRADRDGDKAQPAEAREYASYEEWLEHNPLGPEFANLVTCPEDLNIPALAAYRASVKRQELLMADGEYDGLALAKEAARTVAPRNTLEEMLVDQLAQAYKASMTLLAKAELFALHITSWATKERQQVQSIEAARMAGAAVRTMEAFQRGLLTLDRLQNGGRQTVVVKHLQQVQVGTGGQAVVAGSAKPKSRKQGGGHRK